MRLNRNIRIGAAIVALCLLMLGILTIFRSLRGSSSQPTTLAENGAPAPVGTPTPAPSRLVAVARNDIPERAIVTPEMLVMREVPEGFDRAAFVSDPNAQAVGFITSRPITAGRDVRRADLLGHISDVGIAGALQPGRRAMIIPIGNKATLHELVRIGDSVDIMASFDQQESRTIAEDVRVLAVDLFGADYPQVKIAMRGDYKAPARSLSVAVPPSPPAATSASTNGQANPDAPLGQQPAAGAAAGPEPTPTQGPPPARPEAALTIEVTPQQATDISLTQSAGQNLDFLLRSRAEPRVPTGATGADGVTLAASTSGTSRSTAFTTRDRLAPNAARLRRAAAASSSGAKSSSANTSTTRSTSSSSERNTSRRNLSRSMGSDYNPPLPEVPPVRSIPPAGISGATRIDTPATPEPPATYDIPVYGDGKLMRVDTVKRPRQ